MYRPRRVLATLALAVTAVAVMPPATAAQDGSLQGLVLTGDCPDQFGERTKVLVAPRTPFLFAPMRLLDTGFQPMRKWLFPYSVQVTGEGLKSRHMTPGVTYTRPGRPPKDQVTCTFVGAIKPDGEFQVTITGPIRGQ